MLTRWWASVPPKPVWVVGEHAVDAHGADGVDVSRLIDRPGVHGKPGAMRLLDRVARQVVEAGMHRLGARVPTERDEVHRKTREERAGLQLGQQRSQARQRAMVE